MCSIFYFEQEKLIKKYVIKIQMLQQSGSRVVIFGERVVIRRLEHLLEHLLKLSREKISASANKNSCASIDVAGNRLWREIGTFYLAPVDLVACGLQLERCR